MSAFGGQAGMVLLDLPRCPMRRNSDVDFGMSCKVLLQGLRDAAARRRVVHCDRPTISCARHRPSAGVIHASERSKGRL